MKNKAQEIKQLADSFDRSDSMFDMPEKLDWQERYTAIVEYVKEVSKNGGYSVQLLLNDLAMSYKDVQKLVRKLRRDGFRVIVNEEVDRYNILVKWM